MTEPDTNRKPTRLRVNIPLALPLSESDVVHRAVELSGESRNEFIRVAALARATQVLKEAGENIAKEAAPTAA